MTGIRVGLYAPLNVHRLAGDTVRVIEIASGLRSLGQDVVPFIPRGGGPELTARLEPYASYTAPHLGSASLNYVFLSLMSQYMIPPAVLESSFDIVQVESAYALPLSKLRRISEKREVVFDMHSLAAMDLAPYLPRLLVTPITSLLREGQESLCRKSTCLVVSEAMRQYILHHFRVSPEFIHVVPNGVNIALADMAIKSRKPRYEHLREGNEFLAVYVGGLEWYEGVDIAIRAAHLVKSSNPRFKLLIAGRGSEEAALRALVKRLGLSENVVFLGWVDYEDTFALQSIADVLLAPRLPLSRSRFEISSPVKIPSYLTAGVPIISSRIGDIPNVARHEKEALLLERMDPQSLADSILRLSGSPQEALAMAKACRRRAQDYSWIRICENLADIYKHILEHQF